MKWLMNRILLICIILHVIYTVNINAQNVANLFFGSSFATQNPAISSGCFSDYILKSREISEGYSQDYNECLLEAKSDRQATDDKMLVNRLAIGESSEEICNRLSICNNLNTTLEFFHCHGLIGANNTKDAYTISGNASEYASVLQESYRQIDLRHEQCSKISERKYVEATGANYRGLQSCLEGRIKPLSSTAATVAPATTLYPPTTTTLQSIQVTNTTSA